MKLLYAILMPVGGVFLLYLACLNHIDINEVGVAYNSVNGQVTLQTNAGWYVTSPLTKVVNVDCWPTRVMLPNWSANVIGIKVVHIRKDKIMDYINLQGLDYSWGNFKSTLTAYTFSGKEYSFIEVLQE